MEVSEGQLLAGKYRVERVLGPGGMAVVVAAHDMQLKFSHSYDVSHDARLLWNMAACEKELRHYARAATLIVRYLKEAGNRISLEQRQSALDTPNALRAFCVIVKLKGTPDGATLLVDGTKVGQAPYFLLKPQDSPGAHPEGKLATVYLSLGGAR